VPEDRVWFATTHWSLVLAAGADSSPVASEALERLCRSYWYPLYAYARRRGFGSHDAEDLVQGFFARLLEKEMLRKVQREGGRFRAFLLACFNHFLSDQRDMSRRIKRGGNREIVPLDAAEAEGRYSHEPADPANPAKIFERRWALTVLDKVLARLKAELETEGKGRLFEHLQALIVGEPGPRRNRTQPLRRRYEARVGGGERRRSSTGSSFASTAVASVAGCGAFSHVSPR